MKLVPKPGTEPVTPGWPAQPVTAANLHRQFDYPPVFLPTQPQVMRYVWKEVRQAQVSGVKRVQGGAQGPFRLQRPEIGHKTHASRKGKRRDHTNLIFLKRGKCTK